MIIILWCSGPLQSHCSLKYVKAEKVSEFAFWKEGFASGEKGVEVVVHIESFLCGSLDNEGTTLPETLVRAGGGVVWSRCPRAGCASSRCRVNATGDFERERGRRAQVKLLARTASERRVLDVWLLTIMILLKIIL